MRVPFCVWAVLSTIYHGAPATSRRHLSYDISGQVIGIQLNLIEYHADTKVKQVHIATYHADMTAHATPARIKYTRKLLINVSNMAYDYTICVVDKTTNQARINNNAMNPIELTKTRTDQTPAGSALAKK